MNKTLKTIAVLSLTTLIACGCTLTRGSSVLIGNKRTPTNPTMVKLYFHAPKKYEEIAIVSADARNAFASQQNLTDNTIERLKSEAADLGANGILLNSIDSNQSGSAGVAVVNKGSPIVTGASNSIMGKEGKGLAIYVIEE